MDEGHNGVITYVFARMSADAYKTSEEPIKNEILIGENMKYQNKTIVQTRGSKTWYTRYRYDGKQYHVSGKTQQEVYNKLKLALKNISIAEDIKNYTLKFWIDKWKSLYKGNLRERSLMDLNYLIDKIPSTLTNKTMRHITSIEIREFINTISGDRTRMKVYTVLNDLFDKAVKNEVIGRNPLVVVDRPKYKAKEKYALTETEENLLCAKIKGHPEYYIFAIALLQGLRPGELYALEYSDIDFENRTITINKAIDYKSSDTEVKNEYSNRIIPLFNKTYEIIKDMDTSKQERITTDNERVINQQLKKLVKDITNETISLYNLRHTFITRLGDKNIPEHIIQAWVGHSKGSKVTKAVYTHISKESENKFIKLLNE